MPSKKKTKILAIDVGATNMRFGIVEGPKVHVLKKIKTPKSEKKLHEYLLSQSLKIINKVSVDGVSLCVAGPIDITAETVHLTNITKNDLDLKSPLSKGLKRNVEIINDADAAVLAEQRYGHGKNLKSLIYVTLSTGVGGGVIENNKLRWATKVKEEIGHQKVDSQYQAVCNCGGIGHWASFISGKKISNFMKLWAEQGNKKYNHLLYGDSFRIFWMASVGDKLANAFLDEVGRISAEAIDMFSKKFQPEVFVLGGSIALNNQEVILRGIHKYKNSKVPVMITELGDEISLLGAAVYFEAQNII